MGLPATSAPQIRFQPDDLPENLIGWVGPKVLLDGTPEGVLDGSAALDDAGDRDGSSISRVLEGHSDERTRCDRGVPASARCR